MPTYVLTNTNVHPHHTTLSTLPKALVMHLQWRFFIDILRWSHLTNSGHHYHHQFFLGPSITCYTSMTIILLPHRQLLTSEMVTTKGHFKITHSARNLNWYIFCWTYFRSGVTLLILIIWWFHFSVILLHYQLLLCIIFNDQNVTSNTKYEIKLYIS